MRGPAAREEGLCVYSHTSTVSTVLFALETRVLMTEVPLSSAMEDGDAIPRRPRCRQFIKPTGRRMSIRSN